MLKHASPLRSSSSSQRRPSVASLPCTSSSSSSTSSSPAPHRSSSSSSSPAPHRSITPLLKSSPLALPSSNSLLAPSRLSRPAVSQRHLQVVSKDLGMTPSPLPLSVSGDFNERGVDCEGLLVPSPTPHQSALGGRTMTATAPPSGGGWGIGPVITQGRAIVRRGLSFTLKRDTDVTSMRSVKSEGQVPPLSSKQILLPSKLSLANPNKTTQSSENSLSTQSTPVQTGDKLSGRTLDPQQQLNKVSEAGCEPSGTTQSSPAQPQLDKNVQKSSAFPDPLEPLLRLPGIHAEVRLPPIPSDSSSSDVPPPDSTSLSSADSLATGSSGGRASQRSWGSSAAASSASSASSSSSTENTSTTIRVFAKCLRSDIEYKTVSVGPRTTCGELVATLLSKYRMRHRDPNLFYLTMEVSVKRWPGPPSRSLLVLEEGARPAQLALCRPQGDARFALQMRKGGVIRVHDTVLLPGSQFKSLLVSYRTTAAEVVQLMLNCYSRTDSRHFYALHQVCRAPYYRDDRLSCDERPLEVQAAWPDDEEHVFVLRRNMASALSLRKLAQQTGAEVSSETRRVSPRSSSASKCSSKDSDDNKLRPRCHSVPTPPPRSRKNICHIEEHLLDTSLCQPASPTRPDPPQEDVLGQAYQCDTLDGKGRTSDSNHSESNGSPQYQGHQSNGYCQSLPSNCGQIQTNSHTPHPSGISQSIGQPNGNQPHLLVNGINMNHSNDFNITQQNGNIAHHNGNTSHANGKMTHPNGSIILHNGSMPQHNGNMPYPNGSNSTIPQSQSLSSFPNSSSSSLARATIHGEQGYLSNPSNDTPDGLLNHTTMFNGTQMTRYHRRLVTHNTINYNVHFNRPPEAAAIMTEDSSTVIDCTFATPTLKTVGGGHRGRSSASVGTTNRRPRSHSASRVPLHGTNLSVAPDDAVHGNINNYYFDDTYYSNSGSPKTITWIEKTWTTTGCQTVLSYTPKPSFNENTFSSKSSPAISNIELTQKATKASHTKRVNFADESSMDSETSRPRSRALGKFGESMSSSPTMREEGGRTPPIPPPPATSLSSESDSASPSPPPLPAAPPPPLSPPTTPRFQKRVAINETVSCSPPPPHPTCSPPPLTPEPPKIIKPCIKYPKSGYQSHSAPSSPYLGGDIHRRGAGDQQSPPPVPPPPVEDSDEGDCSKRPRTDGQAAERVTDDQKLKQKHEEGSCEHNCQNCFYI